MSTATPSATQPQTLDWHDTCRLLGVEVHAYFFDPAEVDKRVSFVERYLPVFKQARPRRLGSDSELLNFTAGELTAQPDAVLEHGNGLLCLTYKHTDRLAVQRERWIQQLRVDAMLQSIAGAMAVAGARQLPTVALLRFGNALFHFAPCPPVLECMATNITAARRYWNAPVAVNSLQLASFCESRLRNLPGIGASTSPALWPASAGNASAQ